LNRKRFFGFYPFLRQFFQGTILFFRLVSEKSARYVSLSMTDSLSVLSAAVRDVKDFPAPGILFKDITPILASGRLFRLAVDCFVEANAGLQIDKIVGSDARGFLFGAAVADELGVGFVPVRKAGKLPFQTQSAAYTLEYGQSVVEMHVDAIVPGERVALIDDLLATGGTAAAAACLIAKMGGVLAEAQFLIELEFLAGRNALQHLPVRSFLKF
jgi:adenine phosphoribosyltransferase